jgi:processive 1,2-diacylglycerol beta-glucosyltransferase
MDLNPQSFTVFLQGGGEGAAKFIRTVESVLALPGVQIILAAGTNRTLYDQYHGRPKVHAIPFTQEIAPYMAAADVVMGKAGPNMLFETVTLGKPFVATAYIPGQEKANLEFIQRHNLGWVALEAEAQQQLLKSLAEGGPVLAQVKEGVEAYRKWNTKSSEIIPRVVEKVIRNGIRMP